MQGIIVKGIGGFYYIKAADNNVYECKARGVFRNEKITPVIGDNVEIDIKNGKGSIVKIFKRRNELIRPSVANTDMLVLVVAATSPSPNMPLIDKMLINAQINGIEPIICINKTDLSDGKEIAEIYKNAGFRVLRVCAEKNEGIEDLKKMITGKVSAFAGLSGVGKSSILSIILGDALETGAVSEKILRGRHTTRHVELFELDGGGFVFDTPGFSSLEVYGIKASELQEYFPETEKYRNNCRFRGCMHINEPDCAVKAAVNDGIISTSRYESYKMLYEQLGKIKEWENGEQKWHK